MSQKLDLNQLEVTSFQTVDQVDRIGGGENSWPAVCTCIDICQPSEDIYCSGGCPPENTIPVEQDFAY